MLCTVDVAFLRKHTMIVLCVVARCNIFRIVVPLLLSLFILWICLYPSLMYVCSDLLVLHLSKELEYLQ